MEAEQEIAGTGIGAPMRRIEDRRFVTGWGDFVDDFALPNMAFAYVVRSPHAHAKVISIDTGPACAAPGVFGVLTGQDTIAENIKGLPCPGFPAPPQGARYYRPLRPVLTADFVRHVGDCVALIIAQTRDQAKDAAELLVVDYEVLPAVTLEDALAQGAPRVWQD